MANEWGQPPPSGWCAQGRERLLAPGGIRRVGPYECFGHRFTIDTPDGELAEFLAVAYSTMAARDVDGASRYYVQPPCGGEPGIVIKDGELVKSVTRTPSHALARLIWVVNRHVIDSARDRLVLHSATATFAGRAVVLAAPMESGKTTLVTGLVDRGWTYLTDEATAIGPDLMVEGYPKPLSIDRGAWPVLSHHAPAATELTPYFTRQWQVPGPWIGRWARRAQLGMLVFPRYEPGAGVRFEAISPATAVRMAMACAFSPAGRHRVEALAELALRVPAYRLTHDDIEGCHRRLVDELHELGPAAAARGVVSDAPAGV